MSHARGLKVNGPVTVCMVADCNRTAIYRRGQSQRGYCAKHKHLAMPTQRDAKDLDSLARLITEQDQ